MRCFCVFLLSLTSVYCRVVPRDLLDILKYIHANSGFTTLTAEQQVGIVELVGAAETGTLARYIDNVGFIKVTDILNTIPDDSAKAFEQYLIDHLQLEYGNTTTTSTTTTTTTTTLPPTTTKPAVVGVGGEPSVGKRNLQDQMMHNPQVDHLSMDAKNFLLQLFHAVDEHQLMDFMTAHGWSSITNLSLPVEILHQLTAFIMKEMTLESHHGHRENTKHGHQHHEQGNGHRDD
uniref:Uncharacterized protein n=1 Tax=Pinctada fucata TaxID=50426 RepID=A0A194AMB2_PINFU